MFLNLCFHSCFFWFLTFGLRESPRDHLPDRPRLGHELLIFQYSFLVGSVPVWLDLIDDVIVVLIFMYSMLPPIPIRRPVFLQSRWLHYPARSSRWHLFHHQQRTGESKNGFFLTMTHSWTQPVCPVSLLPVDKSQTSVIYLLAFFFIWGSVSDEKFGVRWLSWRLLQDRHPSTTFSSPSFVTRWSRFPMATPLCLGRFCNCASSIRKFSQKRTRAASLANSCPPAREEKKREEEQQQKEKLPRPVMPENGRREVGRLGLDCPVRERVLDYIY